jgi:hypothetical protein
MNPEKRRRRIRVILRGSALRAERLRMTAREFVTR